MEANKRNVIVVGGGDPVCASQVPKFIQRVRTHRVYRASVASEGGRKAEVIHLLLITTVWGQTRSLKHKWCLRVASSSLRMRVKTVIYSSQ